MMGKSKGLILAMVATFVSGVSIFVNKFAVGAIQPPVAFTAIKNAGVALLLMGWILASGKWKLIRGLKKQEMSRMLAIAVIGGALPFYLFFNGLSGTSAINATLINKSMVLWVTLLAVPVLKERLSKLQAMAVIILFGSNLILGGFEGFSWSIAELMILGATVMWSVENILIKLLVKTVDPDLIILYRMGLGSLVLLIVTLVGYPREAIHQVFHLNSEQMMWMGITMTTILITLMTWFRALQYIPVITMAVIMVSSTVVTNVLSAIFVVHGLRIETGLQMVAVFVGLQLFIIGSIAMVSEEEKQSWWKKYLGLGQD